MVQPLMITIIAQLLEKLADSYEFNIGISGLVILADSTLRVDTLCFGEFVKLLVGVAKDHDSREVVGISIDREVQLARLRPMFVRPNA
jgi:hypothetical protein